MGPVRLTALAVVLMTTACASDHGNSASPNTTAATPSEVTSPACRGVHPVAEPNLTWVAGGQLLDAVGCIVEVKGTAPLAWGGTSDRVLTAERVFLAGTESVATPAGATLSLSRPTGTSVLAITSDGRLMKKALATGTERDISFMAHHQTAVYHPAGRHIVSAGTDEAGTPVLMIADNLGQNPRPLLQVDDARAVGNLAFTASGALLYTAVHEDRVVLHRLDLGADRVTTVASVSSPGTIDHVVTSPFEGGGVAWTEGTCTATSRPTLRATRGGTFLDLKGTEAEFATPVGWLPDGSLAVRTTCQPGTLATLLQIHGSEVERVAENTAGAAVRAVLPTPPAPPANLPASAPA